MMVLQACHLTTLCVCVCVGVWGCMGFYQGIYRQELLATKGSSVQLSPCCSLALLKLPSVTLSVPIYVFTISQSTHSFTCIVLPFTSTNFTTPHSWSSALTLKIDSITETAVPPSRLSYLSHSPTERLCISVVFPFLPLGHPWYLLNSAGALLTFHNCLITYIYTHVYLYLFVCLYMYIYYN